MSDVVEHLVTPAAAAPYRVLARKYRPSTFAELIGQEAMVRTLTNAIAAGRLAHAFMLTGVRGVGKTTTARIIAKGLNCIGADGAGGLTVSPCGVCSNCVAITESRHIDVQEMDAASRTGVNDIREIIDGVRFLPVQARFKVYIIDEVHMLSTSAFNALLKTLEEPPAHVKFIFATTEIRKVPVTVLSRCQRFDLRRIEQGRLVTHLGEISTREGANVVEAALALIARAAEGSVRDALSLLDQAIAHAAGEVDETAVRDMLGLADRARVFDLFEQVMRGDVKAALAELSEQYDTGADPVVVLQDLLELTHWLTRLKLVPDAAQEATASQHDRERGLTLASGLPMAVLARSWQMLLKGLGEARAAPSALAAAEMILIRLAFTADLPPPGDLVKQYLDEKAPGGASRGPVGHGPVGGGRLGGGGVSTVLAVSNGAAQAKSLQDHPAQDHPAQDRPAQAHATAVQAPMATGSVSWRQDNVVFLKSGAGQAPQSFEALVALLEEKREIRLAWALINQVRLVDYKPGHITLRFEDGASNILKKTFGETLKELTGRTWVIETSNEEGEPTLAEVRRSDKSAFHERLMQAPEVVALLKFFPGARLVEIRDRKGEAAAEAEAEADNEGLDEEGALPDIFDLEMMNDNEDE